jgi:hypothetical protein
MSEDFLAQMRARAEEALREKEGREEIQRIAEDEAAQRTEEEAAEARKNELLGQRTKVLEKIKQEKNDADRLIALEAELAEYNEVAEMFAQAEVPTEELREFSERYEALRAEASKLHERSPFNPAAEYRQLDSIDSNSAVMDHIRDEANVMNAEVDKQREIEQLERDLNQAVEDVREFLLHGDWHPQNYISESTIQYDLVAKFDDKARHREEMDWFAYAHLEHKLRIDPSKILRSEPVQRYNQIISRLRELK